MIHPAFAAHQRRRWMRPDAARWLRADAAKFLKRDTDPADVYPALAQQRDRAQQAQAREMDAALAQERAMLDALRAELAQVKSDLAWRRLRDAIARKYSPNQPRVPAGSGRESGRWTSGSGGSSGGGFGQPFGAGDEEAEDGGQLDEIVVDGSDVGFDSSNGSPSSGYGSTNDRAPADRHPTGITDNRVVSDADPESVRPGEQYAAGGRRTGGGQNFDLTPGQAARLEIARSRAEDSVARVREIEPNWKPTPSAYQTADGMIRAYEADAIQVQTRAGELASRRLLPGPFAGESIPAQGPGPANASGQRELNRIGSETGCTHCGIKDPGKPSGNFIGDHHPPTALNVLSRPQRLFPHCASCSAKQGPAVRDFKRGRY